MNENTAPSTCWAEHSAAIAARYQEGLVITTTSSSSVGPHDGGIFSIEKIESTTTDPVLADAVVNYYCTIRKSYFAAEETRDVLVSTVTVEMEPLAIDETVEPFRVTEDLGEDALMVKALAVVESNGWRFMRLTEELHELHRGS